MPKVTYLLGAGASANCLPVVNDLPDRLNDFRTFVVNEGKKSDAFFDDLPCKFSKGEGEKMLASACTEIVGKCRLHASIDTYAKKLYITNQDKQYKILKAVLTCFFIYEQIIKRTDSRYDSFFASILGRHALNFKGDIRILSWNYDFQIESAYSQYSLKSNLKANQKILSVFPELIALDEAPDAFSIFKINGTTSYVDLRTGAISNLLSDHVTVDILEMAEKFSWYFLALTECDGIVESMLKFAWEGNPMLINKACDQVRNSEALVVIGYSFPFFNREVDRQILKALTFFDRAVIYVQDKDTKPVIDKLKSVFPIGKGFPIIPIDTFDQFYLPAEL